eukprot:21121-Pelagococcus_subviridis.AAC.6
MVLLRAFQSFPPQRRLRFSIRVGARGGFASFREDNLEALDDPRLRGVHGRVPLQVLHAVSKFRRGLVLVRRRGDGGERVRGFSLEVIPRVLRDLQVVSQVARELLHVRELFFQALQLVVRPRERAGRVRVSLQGLSERLPRAHGDVARFNRFRLLLVRRLQRGFHGHQGLAQGVVLVLVRVEGPSQRPRLELARVPVARVAAHERGEDAVRDEIPFAGVLFVVANGANGRVRVVVVVVSTRAVRAIAR